MKVISIGGGPAGSTLGTLIKRYRPKIDVLILEREKFPRDHIGESQLPVICTVLDEMGCWDKIERAGFPVKIGATYRWGITDDLWDFEFLPYGHFEEEPRPAKFVGQRTKTAFQVDRSIYDEILLDHAKELGCEVREETKVVEILREGDRVTGLKLDDGTIETADFYVDCSGHAGILRRAMGVEVDVPTKLMNLAFYDYFQNADWPVHLGIGGTRIQIMSVGYGWIWFIPIGETRTSCGLVVPVEYFKQSGMTPEQMFEKAIAEEPRIAAFLKPSTREHKFTTTKDWSFLSERLTGENWALCGEAAGFADPILSAGLSLAHTGAKQLAYILIDMDRGTHDAPWLKQFYDDTQRTRIRQHIRFADFWYTKNKHFTELKENVSKIAEDVGLLLDANEAFQWIGTGGFANDNFLIPQVGEYNISALKWISQMFTGKPVDWAIGKNNIFRLNLDGAKSERIPLMNDGRISEESCYSRAGKLLPQFGLYELMVRILKNETRADRIVEALTGALEYHPGDRDLVFNLSLQILESMIQDGWVDASFKEGVPLLPYETPEDIETFHSHGAAVENQTPA